MVQVQIQPKIGETIGKANSNVSVPALNKNSNKENKVQKPVSTADMVAQNPNNPSPATSKKPESSAGSDPEVKKKMRWWVWLLIIFGVLIAAAVAFYLIYLK